MKKIALALIVISILYSCKKYKDDEGVQLNSPKQRLSRAWVIAAYYENEKDETIWFNIVKPNYVMTLSKNNNFSTNAEGTYSIGTYQVPIEINEKGTWELGTNKKNLILNYASGGVMPYEILKLSKTELWCRELNAPEKEYRFKAK